MCSIPLLPSMLGGVTPSSVIRESWVRRGWTFCQNYGAASQRHAYTRAAIFIQAPECTQTRDSCDMDGERTHEEVAHEKLVTRLARHRDAASEAVLWEDHAKLVQVAKAFGHLLANNTVWAKGGDAAVSFAKKALSDWQENVKHTYHDRRSTTAGRRPLTAMKAKVYIDYVNDFVDWLNTVDEVPSGWLQPWCSTASSIGSTSTPSTQSPCKCSIRHMLRCSAARQPRPHGAGGMKDQCTKIVALQVPN